MVKGVWTRLAVRVTEEEKMKETHGKDFLNHKKKKKWEKIIQVD